MADTTDTRIVLMTTPDSEVAERVVRTLLEERLIACGTIVPGLTSLYRWQGAIEREVETLVVMKTTADAAPALLERAPELHPYDVPELLVLPVESGHAPYLEWVHRCIEPESSES